MSVIIPWLDPCFRSSFVFSVVLCLLAPGLSRGICLPHWCETDVTWELFTLSYSPSLPLFSLSRLLLSSAFSPLLFMSADISAFNHKLWLHTHTHAEFTNRPAWHTEKKIERHQKVLQIVLGDIHLVSRQINHRLICGSQPKCQTASTQTDFPSWQINALL